MAANPALLIDFDGVLRHWPAFEAPIERAHGLAPGSLRRAALDPALLTDLVQGRLADADWREEVAARLRREFPTAAIEAAVRQWSSHSGELNTALWQIVQMRNPGWRLVLVSNASSRLPQDLAALGLAGAFDAVVNSSAIGVAKPQPAFFHAALQHAGSSSDAAVYLDDAEENVRAAAALGLRSHRYCDLDSAVAFLRSHGVLRH